MSAPNEPPPPVPPGSRSRGDRAPRPPRSCPARRRSGCRTAGRRRARARDRRAGARVRALRLLRRRAAARSRRSCSASSPSPVRASGRAAPASRARPRRAGADPRDRHVGRLHRRLLRRRAVVRPGAGWPAGHHRPAGLPTDLPTALPTGGSLRERADLGRRRVGRATGHRRRHGPARSPTRPSTARAPGTDQVTDRPPVDEDAGVGGGSAARSSRSSSRRTATARSTCTITLNGKTLSTATSSGADGVATCSAHQG